MATRTKHILFIIILALLCMPAIQSYFQLIPENPLHGDFEVKEKPLLLRASWLDGSYQSEMDPWMEQHIGFHNGLVRLHNQLDYSLFHKPNAEGVVRGKNGQLFEHDYIRAWTGEDFVGEKLLDRKLRQFRFLQQHLKDKFNTELVLVLEPGKASLYPEDIPDRYIKAEAGKSNFDYIGSRAKELGINLINLNAYFLEIKDTSSFPLFPKQGTHWSEFAMWYAADSLIKYIETTRNIDLPEIVRDGVEISSKLRSTDYDVGVTLNLIFQLPHSPMPYPSFHFVDDTAKQKPNVLAIADSYYWNIFNTRIPKNLFNNEAFWYFYKKVYPDTYHGDKFIGDIDLKAEIEKQDVIFYMSTERFLYKFDRGFVDDLIDIYGIQSSWNELTHYQTSITNLDSWFADVIAKAREHDITLGEMMEMDARYMLWKNNPEKFYGMFGPAPIVNDIKNNPQWFADVKRRAAENNAGLEDWLMEEATFLLTSKYPEALIKYNSIRQISENIRSDSAWHAHVLEKAAAYFMTEEEMVRADAEYVFWSESKKH
ncbi:MAG: hypothetical protein IMY74_09920 [Bacteroidetes bacterium]|nr:hypothetical protein [Bacteroidota bacterium]